MRRGSRAASPPGALAGRVEAGDPVAAGRALSIVVDEAAGFEELSRAFFRHAGGAHKLGVSGPPGGGKSSLVNRLVAQYRKAGERVGVLAVDPTSPFTGGAFLGDRLRIQEHAVDPEVFIRSLGSRGMMGGVSATIFGAIHVLEAWGARRVLIETVGTGQDEVAVSRVADTVLYVQPPSLGDEIQAMKAGAMEAADLFAVNKGDLPGADKAVASLRAALDLGGRDRPGWRAPVLLCSAARGEGIAELAAAVEAHRAWLASSPEGGARAKGQLREELALLIARRVWRDAVGSISDRDLESLLRKATDPVTLGSRLARRRR